MSTLTSSGCRKSKYGVLDPSKNSLSPTSALSNNGSGSSGDAAILVSTVLDILYHMPYFTSLLGSSQLFSVSINDNESVIVKEVLKIFQIAKTQG